MIAIHRTVAGWVSTDRRRRVALPPPSQDCSKTTAAHDGRDLAVYVVGLGAQRRQTVLCRACFEVYQGLGAAIIPERRA